MALPDYQSVTFDLSSPRGVREARAALLVQADDARLAEDFPRFGEALADADRVIELGIACMLERAREFAGLGDFAQAWTSLEEALATVTEHRQKGNDGHLLFVDLIQATAHLVRFAYDLHGGGGNG